MWMIGFWTAPSRLRAKLNSTVSMRVGSTHVTGVPAVTPMAIRPAATRSARSLNSAKVRTRPASSTSIMRSGVAVTRLSSSSQKVWASRMGPLMAGAYNAPEPANTAGPAGPNAPEPASRNWRAPHGPWRGGLRIRFCRILFFRPGSCQSGYTIVTGLSHSCQDFF